jgi:hypothetical protein
MPYKDKAKRNENQKKLMREKRAKERADRSVKPAEPADTRAAEGAEEAKPKPGCFVCGKPWSEERIHFRANRTTIVCEVCVDTLTDHLAQLRSPPPLPP